MRAATEHTRHAASEEEAADQFAHRILSESHKNVRLIRATGDVRVECEKALRIEGGAVADGCALIHSTRGRLHCIHINILVQELATLQCLVDHGHLGVREFAGKT